MMVYSEEKTRTANVTHPHFLVDNVVIGENEAFEECCTPPLQFSSEYLGVQAARTVNKMRSASILSFLCFTFCLNWGIGNSTTVYNATCNDTSECTIYPNISQGPEVIWIPFICNENNFCDCPNGWAPFEGSDICVTKISGSSTVETCSAYVWAIGFFVVTLLAVITYSCVSLFSRRSRASLPMKNDQRFPGISFRAKV